MVPFVVVGVFLIVLVCLFVSDDLANWWRSKKIVPDKKPRSFQVGKVDVVIKMKDGREFKRTATGTASKYGLTGDSIWTYDARHVFNDWLNLWGKKQMVYLGGGTWVPYCNVDSVTGHRRDHEVSEHDVER